MRDARSIRDDDVRMKTSSMDPGDLLPDSPPDAPIVGSGPPGDLLHAATRGRKAVRWLSLTQLVKTAWEVFRVSRIAKDDDKRESTSGERVLELYRLFTDDRDVVCVDFVADTGDGFDATMAVARVTAGEPVDGWSDRRPADRTSPPADLLVFGGDEVYPLASEDNYRDRFLNVFDAARQQVDPDPLVEGHRRREPPVGAIPGNHDWYDNLTGFNEIFTGSRALGKGVSSDAEPRPRKDGLVCLDKTFKDTMAGWGTFQNRSYFAARLNAHWWLWAVDSQLDAEIDDSQKTYFNAAVRELGGASIILCVATPVWLEADDRRTHPVRDGKLVQILDFVDNALGAELRGRVKLVLTGDKHHYVRYTSTWSDADCDPPLVTCGGGGAFLSATQHLPTRLALRWRPWAPDVDDAERHTIYVVASRADDLPDKSREGVTGPGAPLEAMYPTRNESSSLPKRGRWLSLAWRNGPGFPLLTGVFSTLFAASAGGVLAGEWQRGLATGVVPAIVVVAWAAIGARDRVDHRVAFAARNGLVHLILQLLLGLGLSRLFDWLLRFDPVAARVCVEVLIATPPAIALVAWYLAWAHKAGCHDLEAFSGLRFTEYRSMLRMEIGGRSIAVHAIGIREVPSTRKAVDPFAEPVAAMVMDRFTVEAEAATR